ncbi:TIM barrel protein [Burkholderia multivorans]|uniref:TIM barrel protein n=1 Tax=Burkholderia multivorans TaxID=87883 RepID=UPI000CFEBDA2|nr:TIM barrel protein [Burkholderia multivorans]MBU9208138.1 TIM barrel protein [Burkholderia multivorans]PRF34305.1 xylose isomerase [Burkholderia multivorans]HEJ2442350.1 TIM barrel protein [Burkholderia multivorans]
MTQAFHFSLNRICAPHIPFDRYVALCRQVGIDAIEIRNDLDGAELADGTPAAAIRATAEAAGVTILTINALQRFDQWNAARADEATLLADYAAQCGARALVLCPTNSRDDARDAETRHADLVNALRALKPILEARGLLGFIEPLGFEECALRRKSDAVKAIYAAAGEPVFRLVHDTFHHHLAGEPIFFPNLTGLVHLSGVEDDDLSVERMRDGHRVLVGRADRLGNVRQVRELLARGYRGALSFEPFATEIAQAHDIAARLRASIDYVQGELERR